MSDDLQALSTWYSQPFGQALQQQIATFLAPKIADLGVQDVLYLGPAGFEGCIVSHPRIRNVFFTDAACQPLLTDTADHLPLKSETQECIVLWHALDSAANPHAVLREITRIIAKGGYVYIIGFNMFSLWGAYRPLRRLINWRASQIPWQLQFYSISRIRDWLQLLNFDVQLVKSFNFMPVTQQKSVNSLTRLVDLTGSMLAPRCGNIYVTMAQRKTLPLTPRPEKRVVAAPIPKATTEGF